MGKVLQTGNRGMGVGQVHHHALAGGLVPEHDGAANLTVGMDEGAVVLQHGLLGRVLGVVVLGQVPRHDSHRALVLVPPPVIVGVALGPVVHRHRHHIGLAVRVHADHFVGLVQVPGDIRAHPFGVLHCHALALHQPHLGKIAHVDDTDRDVGRLIAGIALQTGAGRAGVLTDAQQEVVVADQAKHVHVA